MADKKQEDLLHAAENADWGQVVANGGPPCFHICEDGLFCLRAKRWEGHKALGYPAHNFVSLSQLLTARERKEGTNG